jgi:hypothetical protein
VAKSLAVSTAPEAASIGVLSEGHIGIERGLRGVVDLSNSAVIEADALVGTGSRVPFDRRSKPFLAGAAFGSYQLRGNDGRSLTSILLCSAQSS